MGNVWAEILIFSSVQLAHVIRKQESMPADVDRGSGTLSQSGEIYSCVPMVGDKDLFCLEAQRGESVKVYYCLRAIAR